MCNEIVGVNGDEGTPVPIPNTVVKLVYGDNTWLATAREDNSTPTSKAATKVAAFSFYSKKQRVFACGEEKAKASIDASRLRLVSLLCAFRRCCTLVGLLCISEERLSK